MHSKDHPLKTLAHLKNMGLINTSKYWKSLQPNCFIGRGTQQQPKCFIKKFIVVTDKNNYNH